MLYKYLSLLSLPLLLVACYSPTETAKIVATSKQTPTITPSSKDSLAAFFDTLFFEPFMAGKELQASFENSHPQLAFYKDFIYPKQIGQVQIFENEYSRSKIHYLGIWKDLALDAAYHVLTNFTVTVTGIGERISPRGRSDIAFINVQTDAIIVYNLSLPNELPIALVDNVLYFESENGAKAGLSISGGLPPLFCVPNGGCYL